MIVDIGKHIIQFILLVLLQSLVISHIPFGSYVNPYPYILFLIILPFETPSLLILGIGLVLGLAMDMFANPPGIHAAACVFTAFARHYILKLMSPREGYDISLKPTVAYMGFSWFATYAGLMLLVHHIAFFFLEMFKFTDGFSTLLRALASAVVTFVFVYLFQFLFYRSANQRK